MGSRFLCPADAAKPELIFPARHQLRGSGVRLGVDLNVPASPTDWGARAFIDVHTLGTAVGEGA
eukprot:3856190-Alexandrium_andersonii.AAC.1